MTHAELIEAALHEHFAPRLTRSAIEDAQRGRPVRLSGAQRQDAAQIAVDALAGAGLVVVPANAHAWLVRVAEYVSMGRRYVDVEPYPDAIARLALGALPERTDTREP